MGWGRARARGGSAAGGGSLRRGRGSSGGGAAWGGRVCSGGPRPRAGVLCPLSCGEIGTKEASGGGDGFAGERVSPPARCVPPIAAHSSAPQTGLRAPRYT